MTIKDLKDLGFQVLKQDKRLFTISRENVNVTIEKVTDTKFRYKESEPTSNIEKLLENINNEQNTVRK